MKIVTMLGVLPLFIKKVVVLTRVIKKYSNVDEIIVHTGQKYDSNMSDIIL